MEPTFSVISVYNNEDILREVLLEGLKDQNEEMFEKILIDNTESRFDSAAEALNHGAKQAEGDYYIFVHQDVNFLEEDLFKKLEEQVENLPDLGLAGAAGMTKGDSERSNRGRNIIYHGLEKEEWKEGNEIDEPTEVQTVDELFILIPSEVFNQEKFDPDICHHWHLYGAEYCLRMHKKGLNVYSLPIDLWHKSDGGHREEFYKTLRKIYCKYPDIDTIHATTGDFKMSWLHVNALVWLRFIETAVGSWPVNLILKWAPIDLEYK